MRAIRFPRFSRRARALSGAPYIVALLLVAASAWMAAPRPAQPTQPAAAAAPLTATQRSVWASDGAWFQRLIYLYASGNTPIQRAALSAGGSAGLKPEQVASVSAAVRAAWIQMMAADPASVGRVGTVPNYTGQQSVLASLRTTLARVAGADYNALLATTDRTYATTSSPAWLSANGLAAPATAPATSVSPQYRVIGTVYATSFCILSAPNQCDTSNYVAVPDAYVKFASIGASSSIPSFYQSYYLRTGPYAPPYGVGIATASGTVVGRQVPVKDVGPWNEDDNWWDSNDPSTVIPASCPVSSTKVSSSSLANAAVDGICPGDQNWRRIYYYLLYQHYATPFFQPAAYAPSGSYQDATAWPAVLPQFCPEAAAASINNDGWNCAGAFPQNYNGNNGAWLRDGTSNAPVLNQSAIDLSPGVNQLLGWTYPSSGYIIVNTWQLP